ncbi:MAG: DNA-directed RNA polymerase [Candidatus Omnitrophica bacterium]|nr:DNA-directed RNA polymerase [Candidatus Omnitrophota bacterium]
MRNVITGGSMGFQGGGKYNSGPREMHKATCGDCGKECEVPFKPREDRPVYCKECFSKHKPSR